MWKRTLSHWCDLHSVHIRTPVRCARTSLLQKVAQIRALRYPKNNKSLANTLQHTLIFLWLEGTDSSITHWWNSNQVNHVTISLAVHPFLRQSKDIFCHRHLSQHCSSSPSVLNLQGLSHSLDWSVGGRRNTGLTVAECTEKTGPLHVVNPNWWNIIPEADLKSTTPPALSHLASMLTYFGSLTPYALHKKSLYIFLPHILSSIGKQRNKDGISTSLFHHQGFVVCHAPTEHR